MSTTAETIAIIERHWRALVGGDVPALMADYAEESILITGATGVVKGRSAIEELLTFFVTAILPPTSTQFTLGLTHADAGLGYIVWQAESATHRIAFSSDTFVIGDGRIVMQTSAGSVDPK